MTKNEAVKAMERGEKVTHGYFTDDEFIYMKEGKIYSEDDVCHGTVDDFFELRQLSGWYEDWNIFPIAF